MRSDRKTARTASLLAAAVLATVAQSSVTFAADKFWDGTVGNNLWNHGPNWGGTVPALTDTAKFDANFTVIHNHVAVDQVSTVDAMFIDGVPPPGAYTFLSVDDSLLFVFNDLTIAGLFADPTPVTFSNLNLNTGRLVLGANGTLTLTGATNHVQADDGLEIFGALNWQDGAITQLSGSSINVNSGAVMNVTAGGRGLGDGETLAITDGKFTSNSYFDIGSSIDAGNGPVGTLSVHSGGSYQAAGAFSAWGHNSGDNANVTFNDSTGTLSAGVEIGVGGGSAGVAVTNSYVQVDGHLSAGVQPAGVAGISSGRTVSNPGGQNHLNGPSGIVTLIVQSDGTLSSTGTTNIGSGATVIQTSGGLHFGNDVTFHGGSTFNWSGGTMTVASGKTLAFDGGVGSITATGGRGLGNNVTLAITNGGQLASSDYFDVGSSFDAGNGPVGTLLVSGAGSSISTQSAIASTWGGKLGDSATVTFSAGGVGTISTLDVALNGGKALVTINGGSTLTINNALTVGGSSTSAGTINVAGGTLKSAGNTLLQRGAVVNFSAGSFSTGSLSMLENAQVLLTSGGNKVLRAGKVSMLGTSKIDLNDNDMIVGALTSKSAVVNLVRTARNGGTWDGASGITSTAAKNSIPKNKTLGILSGSEYFSVSGSGLFAGQSYVSADTLVKYTWYGDTDFNGVVNFDDYSRTDNGFNENLTGWLNGDLDYNGTVNFDDYGLIDLAFNTQGGTVLRAVQFLDGSDRSTNDMTSPGLSMVLQHFNQFGESYGQSFLTAVPEPTTATLGVALGGLTLIRRRRRRSTR